MQLHLKGGCGVQAIRWTFVAFCFLLFVFSVSVLIISAVNYAEMRVAFDEVGSRRTYDFNPNYIFHKFRPEAALGIFYFGMTIGTVFTLISCIGSCGAACLDRCFLIVFFVSLSIVFFGTIIALAVVANIYRDDLQKMAEELYKGFVDHFYGRRDLMLKVMTGVIDTIQRTHQCCGVLEAIDANETLRRYGTWPAHYTALYWLESTQWGQIQANDVGYKEDQHIKWTPDSCCKSPKSNCSSARFGARLDTWNETKEKEWTQKINAVGCGPYLLDFNNLEATDRAKVIAIVIFIIIILLSTIVLACWLCQSLSAYEYSSQDSELDQMRHHHRRRRRRHRRHRRHLAKMGLSPPPTDVVVETTPPAAPVSIPIAAPAKVATPVVAPAPKVPPTNASASSTPGSSKRPTPFRSSSKSAKVNLASVAAPVKTPTAP